MDKQLLSYVHNILNSKDKIKIMTEIDGVFALPKEFVNLEEQNPNFFDYSIEIFDNRSSSGRILPRQITVAEMLEKEEALKKNKKAKDNIQQTMTQTQINIEQQLKEREEIQQQIDQLDMQIENEKDPLLKQQMIYENQYRNGSFRFNDYEQIQEYQNQQVLKLENDILEKKGIYIYFTRDLQGTQEEIAKIKKNKPKNLTNNDLNPLKIRGWLDLSSLSKPGTQILIQRVYLEQQLNEEPNMEATQYNFKNSYVYLKLQLSEPILQEIDSLKSDCSKIHNQSVQNKKFKDSQKLIYEYNYCLVNVIENLNKEYQNLFGKEKNRSDKLKPNITQTYTLQKQQEISKKKEQFIIDLIQNGKYNILKQKLKKVVIQIVVDKFQKEQSVSGMTSSQKVSLISQVYLYLIEQFRTTLQYYIEKNSDNIHEDIVIQQEMANKERCKINQNQQKENNSNKYKRLALEYEIIGDIDSASKYYQNMIKTDLNNDKYYELYAKFLIRHKKYALAEVILLKGIELNSQNVDYEKLLILLFINRERYSDALNKLNKMLKENKLNTLYNILACFIYQQIEDEKMYNKHWQVLERLTMRSSNVLPPKQPPRYSTNPFQLPDIKNKQFQQEEMKKLPGLTSDQSDKCWIEMIDYFCENHMLNLVQKSLDLLNDQESYKYLYYQTNIYLHNYQYDNVIATANQIIEVQPQSDEILLLKGLACFNSQKFYEYEETFQHLIRTKNKNNFKIYIRLGFIYLLRKSWEEAKEVFINCVKIEEKSPLSWLGLGISNFRLKQFKEAEEAFCQSNIHDPYNGDCWGYLSYLYLQDGHRLQQSLLAFDKMFENNSKNLILMEELADYFYNQTYYSQAIQCLDFIIRSYIIKIQEGQENQGIFTQVSGLGELYEKLGQCYNVTNDKQKALSALNKAHELSESQVQKIKVKKLIKNLNSENDFQDNNSQEFQQSREAVQLDL